MLWGSGHSAATEMYWVAAGEVLLFDASGARAGRAVVGDLLGAADLFKPPKRAVAWAWAAASSDDEEGTPGRPENVGPFRARTARVISKQTDHIHVSINASVFLTLAYSYRIAHRSNLDRTNDASFGVPCRNVSVCPLIVWTATYFWSSTLISPIFMF
jgi:hypothetical protein